MTKKLYDQDPYLKEGEATVLSVTPDPDGRFFQVILDQSIFYPEGGGQMADKGWIEGLEVFDVQEKDGQIYHYMKEALPLKTVHLIIDWDRRYDHMQQHTGEHIVSGLFLKLWGAGNKGFHLGEHYVTVDIDMPQISPQQMKKVEEEANHALWQNRGIRCDITDQEGLKHFPIRKEIKAQEDIRIVTIEDIDCCACCGTHVASLSEVGLIKLIKSESYKKMTRVYLISGKRALEDYQKKSAVVDELKKRYSTEEDKLCEAAEKQRCELTQAKKFLQSVRKNLAGWIMEAMPPKGRFGMWQVQENMEVLSAMEEWIKKSWPAKEERENFPPHRGVLLSLVDKKLIAISSDPKDEIGLFFKNHLKNFNGSGGGAKDRAQAGFDRIEDAQSFAAALQQCWENEE